MGSLRVEADEGAFGVRQSGVEGGGGGGLLEGRRPIAMRGQEGLFADGRRVARHPRHSRLGQPVVVHLELVLKFAQVMCALHPPWVLQLPGVQRCAPVARPPPPSLLDTNIWGLPLCFPSACVDWIEDRCCGLASSIEPPPLLARVHRVFSPLWLVDLKRLTSNRSFCFR